MKRNSKILLMVLSLWLSGCTSVMTVPNLPVDYKIKAGKESVVIGNVSMYSSDGKEMPKKSLGMHIPLLVTLKNISSGNEYRFDSNQNDVSSDFFISIQPGIYEVTKVSAGGYIYRMSGRFEVPIDKVVYIGNIKFKDSGVNMSVVFAFLAGRSAKSGNWSVEDDYQMMIGSFQKRYPKIKNEIIKSLIKF